MMGWPIKGVLPIYILVVCLLRTIFTWPEMSLVKFGKHTYYLELLLNNKHTTLFALDFEQPASSLIEAQLNELNNDFDNTSTQKDSVKHYADIYNSRGLALGSLSFDICKNKSLGNQRVKGVIGLGKGSFFIKMLSAHFNKSQVALKFNLQQSKILIETGKFSHQVTELPPVQIKTWTNIKVQSRLSFNFEPPQGFVALVNRSSTPFIIKEDEYNSKQLEISIGEESKQVYLKDLIECWEYQGGKQRECQVKIGADVGILFFSSIVRVCEDGVIVGRSRSLYSVKTEYEIYYLLGIVLNLASVWVFLNRQKTARMLKEQTGFIWGESLVSMEKLDFVGA